MDKLKKFIHEKINGLYYTLIDDYYTPPAGGALHPSRGFPHKADDFYAALIIARNVTLLLQWLPPVILL